MTAFEPALVEPAWTLCHRLIASRFPTVTLFDQIADPADLEFVFAIEGLTNPRLRQEVGDLSLVHPQERVSGPGATLVMAAFTHLNPQGSRFSNGHYGVYYGAESLETAVAEVCHHRALFMARTQEPEIDIDMRCLQAKVVSPLHDLRPAWASHPGLYDANQYGDSQAFGRHWRQAGSAGLLYHSVRRAGGQCVALFKPKALARAVAKGHVALHWNGRRISHWFAKGEPSPVQVN